MLYRRTSTGGFFTWVHSTYFWDHYTDADIYTVDIDPACKAMIDSEPRLKNVKACLL